MNIPKIYLTSSIIINVILIVSSLIVVFNPFGLMDSSVGGGFYHGSSVMVIFSAPFITLPLSLVLFLWGLWLKYKNKMQDRNITVGLLLCITALFITAVLILVVVIRPPKCGPCPLGFL